MLDSNVRLPTFPDGDGQRKKVYFTTKGLLFWVDDDQYDMEETLYVLLPDGRQIDAGLLLQEEDDENQKVIVDLDKITDEDPHAPVYVGGIMATLGGLAETPVDIVEKMNDGRGQYSFQVTLSNPYDLALLRMVAKAMCHGGVEIIHADSLDRELGSDPLATVDDILIAPEVSVPTPEELDDNR
ncbi:MAG: hypothetical protein A2479_04470 [Candidatus Magasanikbacteria bacterium RIFOXYC2_FULL_39_8]|nr:MAG: hypothetical protein A2479_04470 [Candidatus Magasanikbacteria bacterium RIFOXYC2_FULL_39_8]